jgi:hypothetical protein
MNLAALNATISVGDQLYIAAYNAFVTIHAIDSEGVTIGGLCQFLRDSQTNILRTRVDRDILMHMAHPVELGINMEPYQCPYDSTLTGVPVVKPFVNSEFFRNDFWRERDDYENGDGLFRGSVKCYDAAPGDPIDPIDDFDIYDHHETYDDGC